MVSRAILGAFRDGLVEVRRVPRQHVKRVATLERALLGRFGSLQHAIVIQVDGPIDLVQEHLGHGVANYLAEARLRNGERILLGPGRCVFHMSEWLRNAPSKLRISGVTITSVCGDSYPFHDETRNVCLDSDANVNLLSQAFEYPTSIRMTSRHVFHENDPWRVQYFAQLQEEPPTLAVLGVGVLNQKHQLALLTDSASSQSLPRVAVIPAVRERIQSLVKRTQEIATAPAAGLRHTVAEVGMRLFSVPAEGAASNAGEDRELNELNEMIKEINGSLFAPGPEHYSEVRSILLVGGRDGKAHPMKHLLENATGSKRNETGQKAEFPAGLPIHVLCTDEATAKQLLQSDSGW